MAAEAGEYYSGIQTYASTFITPNDPKYLFDGTPDLVWTSGSNYAHEYVGVTSTIDVLGRVWKGEYIDFSCSPPIAFSNVTIAPVLTSLYYAPTRVVILAQLGQAEDEEMAWMHIGTFSMAWDGTNTV